MAIFTLILITPDITAAQDHVVANTPVDNRPRDEFAPRGFRYDSLLFLPSIKTATLFNSNIFATPDNTVHDVALVLSPHLQLRSDGSTTSFQLDFDVNHAQYRTYDSENYTDAYARLRATRKLPLDVNLGVGVEIARRHESREDSFAARDARELTAYNELKAETTISKQFNRLGLELGGSIKSIAFEDVATNAGDILDQSHRDGTIMTLSMKPFYDFSPGYRAYTRFELNRRDYEGSGALNRDSEGHAARLGLDFRISPVLFGSIEAGYLRQNYDNPGIGSIEGASVASNITWLMTPLMTVSLRNSRSISELAALEQQARVDTTTAIEIDYEILRNVLATAQASYTNEEFYGISREDNVVELEGSIKYFMNRNFDFGLKYKYDERYSNLEAYEYQQHVVMLHVTARQ